MAEDQTHNRLTYTCKDCNKVHQGLPAVVFEAPAPYYGIPAVEREHRTMLDEDFCCIDRESFFVRSVLIFPVKCVSDTFEWGTWSSLSKENFERYLRSFEDFDQSKLGPMFSWFCSRLPGYGMTGSLRTQLVPQDNRQRPLVEFYPDETHQIAIDQREGITIDKAIELARPVLHKH